MFPLKTINLTNLGIGQKVWTKVLCLEEIDGIVQESFSAIEVVIESIHFGEKNGEPFQAYYVRVVETNESFHTDNIIYSEYQAKKLGLI